MILGVIAEHSLSLSMAPVILDLAKTLAEDKAALSQVQLTRTTATYKLVHGVAHTIKERIYHNLRNFPFSMNMDESTSNNNKKVLAILVSYLNQNTKTVDVEHMESVEVKKVNSAALYRVLVELFKKHKIPWNNLVSSMMDSCNVMRGNKSGVETRIRDEKNINLLDVDGDSCHHIHNAAKVFAKPFGKWLENLWNDIFEDHRWATDQLKYLSEICDFLAIPFTTPPRFVSHRWLSAYDVTLSDSRMMDAFTVLYFCFLPKSDKPVYQEVLDSLYSKYKVSVKAQKRVKVIHEDLTKKSMTDKGKARKVRIYQKILFQREKTDMVISVYISVLPLLKEYVMVFQGKKTLCHKLHDKQMQTFTDFLACFVKAENLQKLSPARLQKLDLNDSNNLLKKSSMFVGDGAKKIIEKKGKDSVTATFLNDVSTAYSTCGSYLQQKLPLNSPTLQALCAIDPMVKGHSVTTARLTDLSNLFKHLLPKDHQITLEIVKYNVDNTLEWKEGMDIVAWWTAEHVMNSYPALCKVVAGALSVFHGPMVESSFNVMGDVIDGKSSKTAISTYSAYQTVKYSLRSKNTSAIEMFKRSDVKYGSVDKRMCKDIRSAASRYTAEQKENQKKELQRLQSYGAVKTGPASKDKLKVQEAAQAQRDAHSEKERMKARKRALETLCNQRRKKAKIA